MKIKPFNALRPVPEKAAAVASVPYDVVSTEEAKKLAFGNNDSFLHVSRPEIDMAPGTDPSSPEAYSQAKSALESLRSRGVLVREGSDVFYLYRLEAGDHVQTGLVACLDTEEYRNGTLKRHEKTRADKEDDRTRHIRELEAQTGPVFLAYRDSAQIDSLAGEVQKNAPIFDFTAPDGVRHKLWRISSNCEKWQSAFSKIDSAYIADGHHRAAAASRNALERGGEAQYFMGVLFPAGQLHVMPYNRLVKDLNGLTPETFMEKVKSIFTVSDASDGTPLSARSARMYLEGKWYNISWNVPQDADPVSALDVSVLQDRLLAPVLGIDNPRTSPRISFAGGIRGTSFLSENVDSGKFAVAFSMYPVTVEEMMSVADAGLIMPPKSTWFEPKLRSGLFIHVL